MKKKELDLALFEINSNISLELSEQDFNDILSAVGFCAENYPPNGAKHFIKALKVLDKKLMKFWRKVCK